MRETVYKGATRPPLLFGVPLTYGVLVALGGACIGLNAFVLSRSLLVLALVLLPTAGVLVWMFVQTQRDDQRVDQTLLRLSMRVKTATRRRWGCISYAAGPGHETRKRERFN